MTELYYESIEDLCADVDDIVEEGYDGVIDIVAKYNEAKEILRELVYFDYDLEFVELEPVDWDGYDKEYSISVDADRRTISCEKLWHDDRYYHSDAEVVYFMDDVNSKVIYSYDEESEMYAVHVGDCDGDCKHCHVNDEIGLSSEEDNKHVDVDKDGDIPGFNMSYSDDDGYHSWSFYSTALKDENIMKMLCDIFNV